MSHFADDDTLAHIASLEKQLAAAQAENLRLREAIEEGLRTYKVPHTARIIEAIDTPPGDMTALREIIALVLIDMATKQDKYFGGSGLLPFEIRQKADQLRSGEWTPRALK